MNQIRSITAEDFASDCPVPLDLAVRLSRVEPNDLPDLLEGIPETIRARLAVWLNGRSHTHETGVRVAATCEGTSLHRAAGLVGLALYDLSRRPYMAPNHSLNGGGRRQVSLGGSRNAARAFA